MPTGPAPVAIDPRRLAELERLALLGQATAGFAHEVKNGLMVIQGFAFLARRLAESATAEPKLAQHVREVEAEAARLIDELKTFLALARGTNEERPRRALGVVVAEVVRLIKPVAEQRGLLVELQAAGTAERQVADPEFRAGLLNLGLNALDFARTRTRITLARAPGGWDVIVEDDGSGVDARVRSRLFEPFQSGKPSGTGLGLSRAREAVEAERGRIGYDRSSLGGARFSLFVPDAPA